MFKRDTRHHHGAATGEHGRSLQLLTRLGVHLSHQLGDLALDSRPAASRDEHSHQRKIHIVLGTRGYISLTRECEERRDNPQT